MRTLHDAHPHGGLLAIAFQQLHCNWENGRHEVTWYCQLLKEIHSVWPRFKLRCFSDISWEGAPQATDPRNPKDHLGRRFSHDVWLQRWQARQVSLLRTRLRDSQQDYFLFHLLLQNGGDQLKDTVAARQNIDRSLLMSSALFCMKPSVSTCSFRRLLRFAAGLEDYARVNAHHPRRKAFPRLSEDTLRRTGLFCFTKTNMLFDDTEWHSFFVCPCAAKPRELFVDAFPRFYDKFFPSEPRESLIVSMAEIFLEAKFNFHLTNELSRFITGIHVCRRQLFASLSKEGPLCPLH